MLTKCESFTGNCFNIFTGKSVKFLQAGCDCQQTSVGYKLQVTGVSLRGVTSPEEAKQKEQHLSHLLPQLNQGCGFGSGSAFIFPPGSGSGSRRVNLSTKNLKNARKLLITATLLSVFKVNLHKLHCFLLLSNLLCFLQLKKTVHDFFSSNLVNVSIS